MCQIFKPLLNSSGRIVNVSSTGSSLGQYSDEIQQRFRSPKMTLKDLEDLMQEYQVPNYLINWRSQANHRQECANRGTEHQRGWPKKAYSVSKACINALTAVLARENPGLIINACCPGWVSTDMGKMVGSQPPKSPGKFIVRYVVFFRVTKLCVSRWCQDTNTIRIWGHWRHHG